MNRYPWVSSNKSITAIKPVYINKRGNMALSFYLREKCNTFISFRDKKCRYTYTTYTYVSITLNTYRGTNFKTSIHKNHMEIPPHLIHLSILNPIKIPYIHQMVSAQNTRQNITNFLYLYANFQLR